MSDVHKAFENFLKLFGKKDEPVLFRCSLLIFRHNLPILLLSIKDKPLDVHRLWIFLLMLLISSLPPWSYLLIKLVMTTWSFLCVSYPSVSFNNFFNFLSVFISFEISFLPQSKMMTWASYVIRALYIQHVTTCSSRVRPYLQGMILWNTRSSNIFNHEITYDKYFLLFFSWQLSDIVFCCKVIMFFLVFYLIL